MATRDQILSAFNDYLIDSENDTLLQEKDWVYKHTPTKVPLGDGFLNLGIARDVLREIKLNAPDLIDEFKHFYEGSFTLYSEDREALDVFFDF